MVRSAPFLPDGIFDFNPPPPFPSISQSRLRKLSRGNQEADPEKVRLFSLAPFLCLSQLDPSPLRRFQNSAFCFCCRGSALRGTLLMCDYCPLSWHMDCLDPPLSSPPYPTVKWMCPNHADRFLVHFSSPFSRPGCFLKFTLSNCGYVPWLNSPRREGGSAPSTSSTRILPRMLWRWNPSRP